MCITRHLLSRRDVLRLAAVGVPAIALGSRVGWALAASGNGSPHKIRVGDVEITRIVETEGPMMTLSAFFTAGVSGTTLPDNAVEAHRSWLDGWALAPDGTMIFSIQTLLVRTPRHLILVDTCLGGADETGETDVLSKIPYFQKTSRRRCETGGR